MAFSSREGRTPGGALDVLVAINPAALRANLERLHPGTTVILNRDAFDATGLAKAGFDADPLGDGTLVDCRVVAVPMISLTAGALVGLEVGPTQADRSKNFFAPAIALWLYELDVAPTAAWIVQRFRRHPEVVKANCRALEARYAYAETAELLRDHYHGPPAVLVPRRYRNITGNEAAALEFAMAAALAGRPLLYASYPISLPARSSTNSRASQFMFARSRPRTRSRQCARPSAPPTAAGWG